MKKIVLYLCAMFVAVTMNAQEPVLAKFNFEMKSLYGLEQHGMTPMNLNLQLSYEFANRWSVLAAAERNHTQFDVDGVKWYTNGVSLGGGLAYAWHDGEHDRFDLRLQVLNTIGSPDWKHTTFDIGTNWYGKRSKSGMSPLIGIGFRYQKSHTAGIRDWMGIYGTIGVRF